MTATVVTAHRVWEQGSLACPALPCHSVESILSLVWVLFVRQLVDAFHL